MRIHFRKSCAIAGAVLALAANSVAHPNEPASKVDPRLQDEIVAFRKSFQSAGANRDVVALRRYFTDDYTHTHTTGKVDGKDARIISVMAGEPTVEMAPVPEFRLSCFGDSVCIARALSPIKRGDGKWFDVRWTQTYVKTGIGWQIAVSQATGLLSTIRGVP